VTARNAHTTPWPGFDKYLSLVRVFPLRPLRDRQEYQQALIHLRRLLARGEENLESGELDYVAALSRFVRDYEQTHYKRTPLEWSQAERLNYLMEQSGMDREKLGKVLGRRAAVNGVLSGQRALTAPQIRRLADYFRIQADYLL
jgi:antitoxin component HigA of HigAB toxin-antitoxin module